MNLTGRTILITGGSSGIGLTMASQLMAKGNTVLITGRTQQALDAAERNHPGITTFKSDVSDVDGIRALHDAVIARFPELDTLVNNAGVMHMVKLSEDRQLEDVTREIDIDLNGPIRMVQQFLPHLRLQPNALIVNVSSGLAFVPFPISPIYSAAKAGVHAYTRCLRVQLRRTKVTVVELAPPLTETPLFSTEFKDQMKGEKGMPVDVLVRKFISGVEAGKTEIRPGQSNILKIASRIAPELIFKQLSKVG
jgi:uncharacterized oxidoreductase